MSNSAQIVIGVILLISAVFLIIAILMQDSKNEGLSSALTGADNTSFGGKTKSKKLSGTLSKVTTIVAICFVLVVILLTTVNRSLPTPEIDNNTTTAATTTHRGDNSGKCDSHRGDPDADRKRHLFCDGDSDSYG